MTDYLALIPLFFILVIIAACLKEINKLENEHNDRLKRFSFGYKKKEKNEHFSKYFWQRENDKK